MSFPQPPRAKHPIVDGSDGIPTDEYIRWFQSAYTTLSQVASNAPASAAYVLNTANSVLTGAQVLASLNTGFVKVTNNSGLLTSTGNSLIQTSDLTTTGITSGNYTINGHILFNVGVDGRLNSANNISITATPSGTAGGDLSNTYPNPTVSKINGNTLGNTSNINGNYLVSNGSSWVSIRPASPAEIMLAGGL